jgi:transaldolase
MKPTQALHNLGQSLWVDNITRDMVLSGTLSRYINEFSVTGLTSNPTIFYHAISNSKSYDDDIAHFMEQGLSAEEAFFELALKDLRDATDLFSPIYQRTAGFDGFASLEVSPLLASDAAGSLAAAQLLHKKSRRPNIFIKIPGTPEGTVAIEEAIAAGVAINVTLLFSKEQYLASANAYIRGLERRVAAGLSPDVVSVASVFVSRWDQATSKKVAEPLRNTLGIAVAQQIYKAYRDLMESDRWQRLASFGARPQRLLFASTGTKDPKSSDVLYIGALAAPNTINTIPEKTLVAFSEHGQVRESLPRDGGNCEQILANFESAGINLADVAANLQLEGTKSFDSSWHELLTAIQTKSESLLKT